MRGTAIALTALAVVMLTSPCCRAGVYNTEEMGQFLLDRMPEAPLPRSEDILFGGGPTLSEDVRLPDPFTFFFTKLRSLNTKVKELRNPEMRDYRDQVSRLIQIERSKPLTDQQKETLSRLLSFELANRCLERVAELETKERQGSLSIEERINLGAYYIRLQEYEKAVAVLTPAATPDQQNFMLLANLATAHHLAGRPGTALRFQEQALAAWPSIWPGMTWMQLFKYRRIEKYYLALLRMRDAEESRPGGKPGDELDLDALFPRLRFVGPSGQYEAGQLAAAQWDNVPPDSPVIVRQLLLWLPDDDRLQWLLAELLNASGNIIGASDILKELVNKGRAFKGLKEHRQVLMHARGVIMWFLRPMSPPKEIVFPLNAQEQQELLKQSAWERDQLMWNLLPRLPGLAPGMASLANETAGFAREQFHFLVKEQDQSYDSSPQALAVPTSRSQWAPDIRHILVSFFCGVLLALFCSLQIQEMFRRSKEPVSETKP